MCITYNVMITIYILNSIKYVIIITKFMYTVIVMHTYIFVKNVNLNLRTGRSCGKPTPAEIERGAKRSCPAESSPRCLTWGSEILCR